MKVLYFHNSIPEYRKELFVKLSERNKELKFIFTIMGYSETVYNTSVNKNDLDKLSHIALSSGYRCLKKVKDEILSYEPEIIIIPALDTFRELVIAFTILIYAKKKVKLIYVWEKWETPKKYITLRKYVKNSVQGIAAKIIFRRIDLFLSPGRKTTEYFLAHGVKGDSILTFHDVSTVEKCRTDSLREKYKIEKDKKIILYYGRIIKRKGLVTLIDALSITKCKDKVFLFVVGEGEHRQYCEKYADILNLKNIRFEGFVAPEYKYKYFSQSDIFVLPSIAYDGTIEAWGLTVNEALLTDNIVVCSDIVGSAYELLNDKCGFVFKQGNIEELSKAISAACELKKTEAFYEHVKKISAEYSYDNMCQDFENAFRKVLM